MARAVTPATWTGGHGAAPTTSTRPASGTTIALQTFSLTLTGNGADANVNGTSNQQREGDVDVIPEVTVVDVCAATASKRNMTGLLSLISAQQQSSRTSSRLPMIGDAIHDLSSAGEDGGSVDVTGAFAVGCGGVDDGEATELRDVMSGGCGSVGA